MVPLWKILMDIQNRIVTGKGQTAQGSRLYTSRFTKRAGNKLEIYPEVFGPGDANLEFQRKLFSLET